jgi:hypothetical protein
MALMSIALPWCRAATVIRAVVFGRAAMGTGSVIFGLTATGIRGGVACHATLALGIAVF